MIIDTKGVNSATLLTAMKAAILACRTQGWNFHGRKAKANELQSICDAYDKNADSQLVQQFISLAIQPRPFISFSLFGYKFEFGKASTGNTHSAIAFASIVTAAANATVTQQVVPDDEVRPSQENSDDESPYMAIQYLLADPNKPSETTPERPLTPTNNQATDSRREVADIITKLSVARTLLEAAPLVTQYSEAIKNVPEDEKAAFEKRYVDVLIEKDDDWIFPEQPIAAMDDENQRGLSPQHA
jgi:hypothetical protein